MTDYYQKKLLNAYWLHECNGCSYNQVVEHYGYGKAVNDHIRSNVINISLAALCGGII